MQSRYYNKRWILYFRIYSSKQNDMIASIQRFGGMRDTERRRGGECAIH